MTATYRTVVDNQLGAWTLTIVRQGKLVTHGDAQVREHDDLVAVVLNQDQALAERICALLNADGDDEVVAPCLEPAPDAATIASVMAAVDGPYRVGGEVRLEDEDEPDGDAPPTGRIQPLPAEQGSAGGSGGTGGAEGVSEAFCVQCGGPREWDRVDVTTEMEFPYTGERSYIDGRWDKCPACGSIEQPTRERGGA
jgi:hypothetical protein